MLFKQFKVARLQYTTKFVTTCLRTTFDCPYRFQSGSPVLASSRFSTSTPAPAESAHLIGTELKSRSLIRLQGPDTLQFLQGLITNDVNHLGAIPSIFALILNHQGRVLYDIILYNAKHALPSNENQVDTEDTILECDATVQKQLIKHLTLYRLKKKVEIKDVTDQLKVWAVLDPDILHGEILLQNKDAISAEVCHGLTTLQPDHNTAAAECPYKLQLTEKHLQPTSDPRIGFLGWRVITGSSTKLESANQNLKVESTETEYRKNLYSLGVGEGVGDLPPGNCFPLESNGDILHGINFHKGCYVGQELTARSHHTGVIRKRLMPFTLSPGTVFPEGTDKSKLEIVNPGTRRPVGKVRNIIDNNGLALVRVDDALGAPELKVGEHNITLKRPFWWPKVESSSLERVAK